MKNLNGSTRNKIVKFLFWIPLMFFIACGSGIRVQYDYVRDLDFTRYRTFDFINLPDSPVLEKRGERMVKNAVITELELQGFEMRFTKPDFLIAVHTSAESKVDVVSWGYQYAPYDLYYGGYNYWGVQNFSAYSYKEGSLLLDFIEPASMQMIWRGVAQGVIPPNVSNERLTELIGAAVRRVLKYWPPK
jgi:hypothetical protein